MRNFLGTKRNNAKFTPTGNHVPAASSLGLSPTEAEMHASIPPKTQELRTPISAQAHQSSLQIHQYGTPTCTPPYTPSSSLQASHSYPIDIPPRTSSLKYEIDPNSAWAKPTPAAVTRNAMYPASLGEQTCSPRREFQPHEIKILTQWYRAHIAEEPYPTPAERRMLARQCGISTLEVSRWFSRLRKSSRRRRIRQIAGV